MAASVAGRGAGVPGKRECMAGKLALFSALLFVVALAGMAEPAAAAEYKVGDAVGWTIMGSPNYTAWSISKTFRVGDTIVFEYNKQFHNVMEVSQSDYNNCNASKPVSTYTTGNDSIALKTAGHHYFLCGVPTHCDVGQKVRVNVLASSAPAPSSSASSPGSSSSVPPASSPGSSSSVPPASSPGSSSSVPSASSPSAGNHMAGCAVALLAVAVASLGL